MDYGQRATGGTDKRCLLVREKEAEHHTDKLRLSVAPVREVSTEKGQP